MILSTGLVPAGAYATKVRRTLFAQLASKIKSGEISSEEVARASAELNSRLFRLLVEKMGIEKTDVVRIRIPYVVREGRVVWDEGSLLVEVWERKTEHRGMP